MSFVFLLHYQKSLDCVLRLEKCQYTCYLPYLNINCVGGKEEQVRKRKKYSVHLRIYVPKNKANNKAMWLTIIWLPGSRLQATK